MSETALREAFATQADACAELGSPFMQRLMTMWASRVWPGGRVAQRLTNWEGDLTPSGQSVPLRLAGALHELRLRGHDRLVATYPPADVEDDTLWQAVTDVVRTEADMILGRLDSPPQTNEVRRSTTLIPVGHWLTARYGSALRLSEMGASRGLNLMWDRFRLIAGTIAMGPDTPALTLAPDWSGTTPVDASPTVVERRGVDLAPPRDDIRLLSYLWPDQPHRLDLTRAALSVADATVDTGDAAHWLRGRLTHEVARCHLVYTTVAYQYFPTRTQTQIADMIEATGQSATRDSALAWFSMEADGGRGAALTLRLWPGDITIAMGRADFHGRWVDWTAPQP